MDRFGLPIMICFDFVKEHVPIKDHIEVVSRNQKSIFD
jgi:hypothetical protein